MHVDGKKVLVTGGAGFIGSHVCSQLIDDGADVQVFDNFFRGVQANVPEEAELIEGDIIDDADIKKIGQVEPDVILHLAAIHYVPYCTENPQEAYETNVLGTRKVLNQAQKADVDKVVAASSAAVYPPRGEPNTETSELKAIDVYGDTKILGEDLYRLFNYDTGIGTVGARLFNVFGTKETNPHLIPAIIEQVKEGTEVNLGNLTPSRDFVYVTDVANALIRMVTESPEREYRSYNVGTGRSRSVKEVYETVERLVKKDITLQQDQDRVRESDRPNLQADISRISEELDWQPSVEFEEGIRRILRVQDIETAR
jgi:UDP-glucose 4-epimerase